MRALPLRIARSKLQDETWLYVVLLLVLESVYGWALFAVPGLRALPQFLLFTTLMLTHLGLHLGAPQLVRRRGGRPIYYLVQAVLAVALCAMTRPAEAPFALYLFAALAGQSVALVGGQWRSAAWPVGAFSALGLGLYGWWWGWERLPAFFVMAMPQGFFVVAFVFLFMRQANARRQTQVLLQELEQAHQALAAYAEQVEALTLTAERQRLARELHDTLAQGLAGIILRLEAIDARLAREQAEQARTLVEQTLKRARTALAEARQAIDALRAAQPEGLSDQLQDEVERFRELTGLPCPLQLGSIPPLPDDVEDTVLRAVREGLANVARHARAGQAQVRITYESGQLLVLVQDDGRGFDPAVAEAEGGHYGLAGLRERARLAGGAVEVTRGPAQGTVVRVWLPLQAAPAEAAHA